jgi:hypothetical protein
MSKSQKLFEGYINYNLVDGVKVFESKNIKTSDILNFKLNDFAMSKEALNQDMPIAKVTLSMSNE